MKIENVPHSLFLHHVFIAPYFPLRFDLEFALLVILCFFLLVWDWGCFCMDLIA